MDWLDDILGALGAINRYTPDRIGSLEAQAIALFAAAATNRFAPSVIPKAINNPATRFAAGYVARHPLATLSAFTIASYRNSYGRSPWAGPYTREIETALLTPTIGWIGRGLGWAIRNSWVLLRPGVANALGGFANILSYLGHIRVPESVVNNPATRGIVRYITRHPIATLASYFAVRQLDQVYRPRLLGPIDDLLLMAGLTPVFAKGPGFLPGAIRYAGAGVNYGARGTATSLEWLLKQLGPQTPRPRGGEVAVAALRPLGGLGAGLVAEYLQWRERERASAEGTSPAWWARIPGSGLAAGAIGTGASYWNADIGRRMWGQFVNIRRGQPFSRWSTKLPPIWTAIIDFKWLPAVPQLATWAGRASWAASFGLYGYGALYALGLHKWIPESALWTLGAIKGPGFFSPFFQTGTLRGAGTTYLGWLKTAINAPVNAYRFARSTPEIMSSALSAGGRFRGLEGIADVLRLVGVNVPRNTVPQIRAQLATLRSFRIGVSRFAQKYAPGAAAFLGRNAGRVLRVAGPASLVFEANHGDIYDEIRSVEPIIDLMSMHLDRLQTMQNQGVYIGPSIGGLRNRLERIRSQALPTELARVSYSQLDYVRGLYNYADFPETRASLAALAETLPFAAAGLADATANFLEAISNLEAGRGPDRRPRRRRRDRQDLRQSRDPRGLFSGLLDKPPISSILQSIGGNGLLSPDNPIANLSLGSPGQSAGKGYSGPLHADAGPPGGKGRHFWLFRERDRRLLLQTWRNLTAIVARDELAASGTKTTKISTRQLMLPSSVPGLHGAVGQVIEELQYDLSLVRQPGTYDDYYSLDDPDYVIEGEVDD